MAIKFNQINGTASDNSLNTTPGQDIVFALNGNDTITADFQSIDYIVGGNGDDTIKTNNLPYASFSIKPHDAITDGYIVRYDGGKANIVKGIEFFQFAEGTISLEDFYAGKPIATIILLDGRGELGTPETTDAGTDNFLYKDDLSKSNFVVIENFSTKESTKEQIDQIEIIADADDVVSIYNDGEDVIITNNSTTVEGDTVISSITLLGVVSAVDLVSDIGTLNGAMGFEALKITTL